MHKKQKIYLILWGTLVGISFVMVFFMNLHDAFFYIGEVATILWFLLSAYLLFSILYQQKQIKKNFKTYEEDIDKMIEFCLSGIQKYWVYSWTCLCYLQLGICYLKKNEIENAKQALSIFTKSNYKASYYPNFIIAILEDNIELAHTYYKKIKASNFPFENQANIATKIMQMIETKVFDEELVQNSQYPCVKEFCLKYKND